MIICASPNDENLLEEAQILATRYKEKFAIYGPYCLREIGKEQRITILSHANNTSLGDNKLTPEILVADLISFGIPKKCTLDLICCGNNVLDTKGSYSEQVCALFIKQGYTNIQVNSFSNAASIEWAAEIAISTSPWNLSTTITGMTPQAKKKFDGELKNAPYKELEEKTHELLEQKLELHKKIIALKILQQDTKTLAEKHRDMAKQFGWYQTVLGSKKIDFLHTLHNKLGKEIYREFGHIRQLLDENENFHVTKNSLAEAKILSKKQKHVIIILNNRIAELRQMLRENNDKSSSMLNSLVAYFNPLASPREKEIPYQIEQLQKYVNKIKNSKHEGEVLVFLEESLHDEKLMNEKNNMMLQEILAIFSLDKNYLASRRKTLVI